MIKFIICEDEEVIRKDTVNKIEVFMLKYYVEYKIYEFSSYNKEFEDVVKTDDGFKVYFLDIKTDHGSGIDAARIIREKYDDWVSIIIILTSFLEYKYEALSSRLYLLDYINKLDNSEKKINEDLMIALKAYDKKSKTLGYEYNHMYYRVEFRQIMSIEKEKSSKRCIIKTTDNTYYITATLNEVCEKLDERFYKSHKSMVVNIEQIESYDVKSNTITFKNGEQTSYIARGCKKGLIKAIEK